MAKNKNRVSPANILAIIGLAGIGVLTFFGTLFQSEDGSQRGAIITAAALTLGLSLLIIFMVRAKTTEDDFNMWRIAEWVCLAAYLVVAALFYKPVLQFFHIVQHKEELQTMALKEIEQIDSINFYFNKEARNKINETTDQIESYLESDQCNAEVDGDGGLYSYTFSEGYRIDLDRWKSSALKIVSFENKMDSTIKADIIRWNLMELSSIAYRLKDLSSDNWTKLNDHIKKMKGKGYIPVINYDGIYKKEGLYEFDKIVGEKPQSSAFVAKFREPVSGNNVGWIVYIVLHVLVLLNYFLVRRSPIIQIRKDKRKDDGGLVLDVNEG